MRYDVEHRGALLGQLHQFPELLLCGIRFDLERHPDVFIPVPHILRDPQEPSKIEITLQVRLHFFDGDTAGRAVIHQ